MPSAYDSLPPLPDWLMPLPLEELWNGWERS